MKKYDSLYFDSGLKQVLIKHPMKINICKSICIDIDRIIEMSAKNIDNLNGEMILQAVNTMFVYKLAILKRISLNIGEESLIALFGRVLSRKNVKDMSDSEVKILISDFARHIFYELTSDRNSKNWLNHLGEIPLELLNIVGFSSFGEE